MTFTQLRAFATVARLGSLSAAAHTLGVTEPAVAAALASLRRDLGDPLYVRAPGGVRLTPGGERLAAAAAEMLGLEDRVRREVSAAGGATGLLRLAVSQQVAEYVSAPMLDAFTRRWPRLEVAQEVTDPRDFAALLGDRRADVVLGPEPAPDPSVEAVPFLRYKLVAVCGRGHRLAAMRDVTPIVAAAERWLVGPSHTDLDRLFARLGVTPPRAVGAFATDAAAHAAAAAGEGVALAIAHTVIDALRRGSLVRVDLRGTPLDGLWHVATLSGGRSSPEATALRRFVTTADATQAIIARPGGVPAGRFRPPVYVTIWSAVEVP